MGHFFFQPLNVLNPQKEALKENIKPHSMHISPWLVSSDVVTGSAKEATIIRKSVITTQL